MSSTFDNITCPLCGGFALREQNHKTNHTDITCDECGYDSGYDEVDDNLDRFFDD